MHYLISGLAKSGTTRLFAQLQRALAASGREVATSFEPYEDEALRAVLAKAGPTLTKVLIGRVKAENAPVADFDRHVMIFRDPRDQFLSTLLYLFYDFQVSGDADAYRAAYAALEAKIADPEGIASTELYSEIARLAGRAPVGVFRKLHDVQREFEAAFQPYPLRYESLVDGEELGALEDFLGLELENRAVQVPSDYARVARSRSYGEWRRWFNEADVAFARREWGAHMEALGYDVEEALSELPIEPASSLEYVRQFDPSLAA